MLQKGACVCRTEQQVRTWSKQGMWLWMVELFSFFYFCHSVSTGEIKCVKRCSSMVGGKCSLIPLCNNSVWIWGTCQFYVDTLRCRFWKTHQEKEACCNCLQSFLFISDKFSSFFIWVICAMRYFFQCENTPGWQIKFLKIEYSEKSSQVLFFLFPRGLLTLTLSLWSCISLAHRAFYAQKWIYSQKR